jgi:hypothetical protein
MSRIGALAVLHLAAVPAAVPDGRDAPAGPLTLACEGVATNPVGDPTRSTMSHAGKSGSGRKATKRHDATAADNGDAAGDGDGDATITRAPAGRPARGANVEFVFEFAGDHGRVLYPAAIVPVVHSGDRDGWWPVRDLAVSDEAFSGRILLNFVNHARFTIDRHTGVFNLAGLQANVAGRCARADRGPRLF